MSKPLFRVMVFAAFLIFLAQATVLTSIAENATPAAESEADASVSAAPRFVIVADDDQGLGYFSDVEIEPGESKHLSVAIMNVGDVPASLRTYKVNALNSVNGGFITDEENSQPVNQTTWLDYPPLSLELGPGEERSIDFTIQVPEDTVPGQYISGLVVETSEALPISGTDSLEQILAYSISVGVLVPGEKVSGFELGSPDVVRGAKITSVVVPITNTGNYLVRPQGEFELIDADRTAVMSSTIDLGSIYAALSTSVEVILPDQMPPGDYTVELSLTDPESGAKASIEGASVTIPEPVDPTGVSVTRAAVEPNAVEIVFANVDVALNNGGQQIPASDVMLQVLRDGEQVDEFPLATNQVLLNGENTYTTRYIPAEMWESGTYTFRIEVSAVDPNGGQETILLDEDLDAEIVVP